MQLQRLLPWVVFCLAGMLVKLKLHTNLRDTGQIADLMVMDDYKSRFAQHKPDGMLYWNTWIQGLVVGLLSVGAIFGALVGAQ